MEIEWDEVEEKDTKFYFGDEVMIPNGDIGKVTEIDGQSTVRYHVASSVDHGWFTPEELTKVL
jgi:hypothetical protein